MIIHIVNASYTGHGDSVRERVMINDVYSDIGTTTKEDLEHTYASGTYSLAMDMYDVPKAVTMKSPLFDLPDPYADVGPYEEVAKILYLDIHWSHVLCD